MQSIIKQRAKERKLEFEKAEQAKRMAEALVSEESGRAMHSPLHAPRASNSPSRSSSPTLERLRTALGGNLATDGDESQRANLAKNDSRRKKHSEPAPAGCEWRALLCFRKSVSPGGCDLRIEPYGPIFSLMY